MTSKKMCCVPTCPKGRSDGAILHVFPNPHKYPERFKQWLYNIGGNILGLDSKFIFEHRRVCHEHFEPRFHTPSGRLSYMAVPTLKLSDVSISEDIDPMDFLSDVNITTDPVTTESLPEVPGVTSPFTWHKPSEVIDSGSKDNAQYIGTKIVTDDVLINNDNVSPATNTCKIINQDGFTNEDNVLSQRGKQLQYRKEYKCNLCSGPIEGFRYRCVQCADYDLCAACEARGAHERHYVLRIPGRRPYAEVEAVLQKIKTELFSSGSHLVLPEDTQILDSTKEDIKVEEQDLVAVGPTDPLDPLSESANDAHMEVMSSQSNKEESEQQEWWEANDFKRTKRKFSDSASEHDYSIRRDNAQTYSSNTSNKKLILDNRIQKPDDKTTRETRVLDNSKLLINGQKRGQKYRRHHLLCPCHASPQKLSDPKVLVTRFKPLNTTGVVQLPTNTQLPGIPLKQKPTTTVPPSNSPSTSNILKTTQIVTKK